MNSFFRRIIAVVHLAAGASLGLGANQAARADIPIKSYEQLEIQGFRPGFRVSTEIRRPLRPEFNPGSLDWPVAFEGPESTMGNTMAQFQRYGGGSPYFHGGCDLRTRAGEKVLAPVSGRLEAGHYSYAQRPDGNLEKFMKPWPETGEALYFELSIVDDRGFRFEFHHVDRASLPASIVRKLNESFNPRVEKGEWIGNVVEWPVAGAGGKPYHHLHYNIIDPQGVRLNPEHYSFGLSDSNAPEIHGVYVRNSITRFFDRADGVLAVDSEVVVAATDQRKPNLYTHTPPRVQWQWNDAGDEEQKLGWNFLEALLTQEGFTPDIRQVFASEIRTSEGQRLQTQGDYSNNFFLFRMPKLPMRVGQSLELIVQDQAGNSTRRSFQVR